MTGPVVARPVVQQVLDDADDLAVCIITKRGPHTTPELFAVASGAIWCLTAATTLKAKLLANGGPVGMTATAGSLSMIATGVAEVVDSARPLRALRNLGATAAAPAAVGQFALRNAAELTGAARTSRASVTRNSWTGFGPSGKQGVMLRGSGTTTDEGRRATIAVEVDGVAYWDGIETGGSRSPS